MNNKCTRVGCVLYFFDSRKVSVQGPAESDPSQCSVLETPSFVKMYALGPVVARHEEVDESDDDDETDDGAAPAVEGDMWGRLRGTLVAQQKAAGLPWKHLVEASGVSVCFGRMGQSKSLRTEAQVFHRCRCSEVHAS